MTTRILHVVTNVSHYEDPTHPTGLWLTELAHPWNIFGAKEWEQAIVSPAGGKVPLEPPALKWPNIDATGKAWLADPRKMALLENTASPADIRASEFDAIFFTGGHGVMFDFPKSEGLQAITRDIFETGGVVAAVCHGYCGLLETRLSDGKRLVDGRNLTGYSWLEEILAGVAKDVPYDVEQRMKDYGADYTKGLIPFLSHVVVDGRLVTGQNPWSATETAKAVANFLESK
ncbi:MAG: type 1 glutamine amidotransferase domain-containing protein [Erythrobacter sp.]|nr:type 1 glutamine amidotransferase domain-containing protein [Erythrobacter sp.]